MEENMQRRLWGILIENELYKLLEFAKDENEREQFIERFSRENNIPIEFVKEKITHINQTMKNVKGDNYQER